MVRPYREVAGQADRNPAGPSGSESLSCSHAPGLPEHPGGQIDGELLARPHAFGRIACRATHPETPIARIAPPQILHRRAHAAGPSRTGETP